MKTAVHPDRALLVVLSSCLENEEEITVRGDGSATVRCREGNALDLGDVIRSRSMRPATTDARTNEWLRLVGDDTGSARCARR